MHLAYGRCRWQGLHRDQNLIDDARRENAFGLMMSLNMLIEFGDAFDFTSLQFLGLVQAVQPSSVAQR